MGEIRADPDMDCFNQLMRQSDILQSEQAVLMIPLLDLTLLSPTVLGHEDCLDLAGSPLNSCPASREPFPSLSRIAVQQKER
jgi:hypothetical protein